MSQVEAKHCLPKRVGILVVIIHTFDSDDLSSNPTDIKVTFLI